jgi:CheY-like chemotaxis protein
MRIKFWGTRGSIPTPGPRTVRYGGNTSCVELRTNRGILFILDCGTGLRELGRALMQEPQPIVGNILLSHTHWDHTQGFAFFGPVFQKGNQFTIIAAPGVDRGLAGVLAGQMDYLYFPLTLDSLQASIAFKEVGEESFMIGDVQVRTRFLNHTILTLGFRITSGGVTVTYISDHEPFSPNLFRAGVENPSLSNIIHDGDRQHVGFLAGSDVLIHDAQYTSLEYTEKHSWGHSTAEYVIDVAMAAGVKQVVLTHHDPEHDDDFIDTLQAHCQARARAAGSNLQVIAAYEGMEIFLPELDDQSPGHVMLQPAVVRLARARILVADDEPGMVRFIQLALAKDGYDFLEAKNGEEAIEAAQRERPDLILLDVQMPRMDGYEVAQRLRALPEFRDIPIIMLTAFVEEENIVHGFASGVNDYIGKPVAPSLLRARVRRWLLHPDQKVGEAGNQE